VEEFCTRSPNTELKVRKIKVKDRLRQQYLTWISDPARELTKTGKIKRAASSEVVRWVSAAWKALSSDLSRNVA
jgi:hypothetical protein